MLLSPANSNVTLSVLFKVVTFTWITCPANINSLFVFKAFGKSTYFSFPFESVVTLFISIDAILGLSPLSNRLFTLSTNTFCFSSSKCITITSSQLEYIGVSKLKYVSAIELHLTAISTVPSLK